MEIKPEDELSNIVLFPVKEDDPLDLPLYVQTSVIT